MRQHASLRAPASPRRIHDASRIFALPLDKLWVAFAPKLFPTISTAQIRPCRSFRDKHNFGREFCELRSLRNRAPQVILDNQKPRLRMCQQLEMLRRRQVVLQWKQHSAAKEKRI